IKKNPDSMGPVVHPNNLDQILKILWFALLAAIVIGLMILAAPLEIIAGIAGCILLMFGVLKSVDTPNLPEYTVNSIAKDLSSFSATITYVDQSFFIDGELQEDGDPRVCVEEVETSNVTCLDRTKLLSAKKYYNKLTQLYSTVTSWIWR
ncbi:MAG: hypothetical protein KDD52_09045, partial [Bdellovibrionales bacterium]|nr:hypothetical protein [Bdellovibrionales bacterium]